MNSKDPADVRIFLKTIKSNPGNFFRPRKKTVVTRAPGRIDVMGGIADYSGSLVLEGTLAEAAKVALQRRHDRRLRIISLNLKNDLSAHLTVSLDDFFSRGKLVPISGARALLTTADGQIWPAYLLGAFYLLMKGKKVRFRNGADLFLRSNVPLGAGVSSSAAIEVAAMTAINCAYNLSLEGLEIARLCQQVENYLVGAPCGIMDQVTSCLGEEGKLTALRCQPDRLEGTVAVPEDFCFAAINSGVKHSVGGTRYTRARVGAFMGLKVITSHLGKDPYGGYLTNIAPEEFRRRFHRILPGRIKGSAFLRKYGETTDKVTTVEPETIYSVRGCTEHPVYENARVERFRELLQIGGEQAMAQAGKLMYASHWSYGSRVALGCRETDILVNLVRRLGPSRGLYGAKITGGGSGGTVVVLCRRGSEKAIAEVKRDYRKLTGITPEVYRKSSPGALQFGCRWASINENTT